MLGPGQAGEPTQFAEEIIWELASELEVVLISSARHKGTLSSGQVSGGTVTSQGLLGLAVTEFFLVKKATHFQTPSASFSGK